MRRSPIVLTLAVAALLAACGSSSAPGWTYAPPTEAPASAAPSGDASAPPASEAPGSEAPASEAPGSEAPASEPPASAAPSGGAGGGVTLTASGINWVEKELTAPADMPFSLRLDNQDNGVPHDVVIKDGTGAEVVRSEIITGIATVDLDVPALAPGAYTYVCSIHPNMTGTLTAGG
jgi:hypothetical protein